MLSFYVVDGFGSNVNFWFGVVHGLGQGRQGKSYLVICGMGVFGAELVSSLMKRFEFGRCEGGVDDWVGQPLCSGRYRVKDVLDAAARCGPDPIWSRLRRVVGTVHVQKGNSFIRSGCRLGGGSVVCAMVGMMLVIFSRVSDGVRFHSLVYMYASWWAARCSR